ncbi:MAG TPA: O-methyltransferase [Bacteroidales bacterium]|nr:O-methyltransferase [Bacteroidales bacterium]
MKLHPDLEQYIENHSSIELPILKEIYKDTYLNQLNPRMVSGHNQGLFLIMISKMIKPKSILEIGTFTGYSAICLAQGLTPDGILHTIEIDDEIASQTKLSFNRSGLGDKIKLHVGSALDIIHKINTSFDLIFIDGEKREYPQYLELCLKYLNVGGYLIADNVLWNEKVIDPAMKEDKATKAVIQFNEMVHANPDLLHVLLPLRDGLMMCQKIR